MATLVLSTVGTALGGPVGGAIGSLLGQAIDQQIFGPGPRHGPRLGDLSVQTSSYGTPIPRVYGTMRVAGSIVWAADLKENAAAEGGAKGQPETVTYSYSGSFAVGLSSRGAVRVGRIWADGKLLRGAAGDFKVKTQFRFYGASEDQPIDPLIATVEGIASTPAYRGVALAVFEDLELAEYGDRIPFLTFELVADEAAPTLGAIFGDASENAIECADVRTVQGYAAHGGNIGAALQPLFDSFAVPLLDDGAAMRSPGGQAVEVLQQTALGSAAGTVGGVRVEKAQAPASSLPTAFTLNYYDRARDFQTSQAQAVAAGGGKREQIELPAVLAAPAAKALAETSLARRWAQRESLTVRLPPTQLGIQPGSRFRLPSRDADWVVEKVTIDSFVAIVEARADWIIAEDLPADEGRVSASADVVAGPTRLELLDLPDLGTATNGTPTLHLAAASSSGAWKSVPVEIAVGGSIAGGRTAAAEAIIGAALTVPGSGGSALVDVGNAFDVELANPEQWLQSCDDEALANGANLAALGDELIQFGSATPIGGRRFRLERLLRGRRGTEYAVGTHGVDEAFVMLTTGSARPISLPPGSAGTLVTVTAHGLGDGAGTSVGKVSRGEALRPPSPVHLSARVTDAGDLEAIWVRRSRFGWTWSDEIDAAVGENREAYRVRLQSGTDSLEIETATPTILIESARIAGFVPGEITVSVVQVGDFAVSWPAETQLNIS